MPKFLWRVLLNIWELSITEEHISFIGEKFTLLNNSCYFFSWLTHIKELWSVFWWRLRSCVGSYWLSWSFQVSNSAVFHRHTVKFWGFYLCTNGLSLFSMESQKCSQERTREDVKLEFAFWPRWKTGNVLSPPLWCTRAQSWTKNGTGC